MMTPNTRDFLIPGEEYLQQFPDFTLVGRQQELNNITGILMRKSAHNVLIVGPGGVGCSSLCLGLQATKSQPNASLDIIGKRFYWLDIDGLFASGEHGVINESFQRLVKILSRTAHKDTVLVIEDTRVFIDAARTHGCSHFINSMMRELRRGRFQMVLEARDDDLEVVLKAHPDINQIFTMVDVLEPSSEALNEIVTYVAKGLQSYHGIAISETAIETAITLTDKYRVRDLSLSRAQPERTINLLDRAFATYRHQAHSCPPNIVQLEQKIELNPENREALEQEINQLRSQWQERQETLNEFAQKQRQGEDLLVNLESDLEEQIEREKARDKEPYVPQEASFSSLSSRMRQAGMGSPEVERIRQKIKEAEQAITDNRQKFQALTSVINEQLLLDEAQVTAEFSRISGIPADKLNQDERAKLLGLETALKQRVFGQDHAMDKLAGAVRVARAGLKEPNKPQSAFLYCGPSGVGKTEAAKALTFALMGDERALLRFDMSEYMEKHAVAKLIGAPPGYEGYEAGGILTNSMRRNPHVNILFDEIEKAHPDVFNVLLQVLDDGRLTDNRGLTVSFSEANIIMTTNIGQPYFLDKNLSFEEASAQTMVELDQVYRPEFLNRFNGRENIVCFNRLDLPVIALIARREITKINQRIQAQGSALSVSMSDETIMAICQDKYEPARGARGIPGYFSASIYPAIANMMLQQGDASGVIEVSYDASSQELLVAEPVCELDPA